MQQVQAKPRLVFFQYKYDERLTAFLLVHTREHVRCLSQFFEVKVINEDCDYQQVCDEFRPDLALFESGVPFPTCRRPRISNLAACPQVPKLGFLHSDSFSEGRAGFMSDMDHWGIDTFFAIATTAAEYTPALADRVFVWPNFVEPEIYHDYGLWKSIPVLFTGNQNALYPWRQRVTRVLARHFPCLSCPHPGYTSRQAKPHVIEGERYARTINSSFFVPACGTVANEIIRKHFEVPGSRACLITESSAAIQAAGFVDMKNCVIADENDVVDKVAYLLANPEELEAITQAGYDLVHSRHTIRQRDQLLQWFRLHQQLKDGERIIQPSPFEALRKVATSSGITSTHVHSRGLLITTIGEGDENLRQAKYEVAERQFLTCVNYYRFMPEPQVKLAISLLYRGKAEEALSWIHKPIRFTLLDYKALDPDPVEWALLIRTLLCSGRVREASERAAQFPWMRHPELDRVRSLVSFLNRGEGALKTEPGSGHFRQSIHELPWGDSSDWTEELIKMLRACGQGRLAERLASAPVQVPPIAEAIAIMDQPEDSAPPVRFQADGFAWARFSSQAAEKFRETAKVLLRLLENRFGYFLPFALSQVRYDEFFALVRDLARDERMKKILVIGASRRKRTTQAVLTGVKENPNKPLLLCVSTDESDRRGRLKPAWYSIGSSSRGTRAEALSRTIEQIRREWSVDGFDVVVIDSTEADLSDHQDLRHISEAAQVLCLEGIDRPQAQRTCATFLDNADYWLLEYNPGLRNGYAVFEKQQHSESLDALEPLPAHSHDAAAERKYSVVASK